MPTTLAQWLKWLESLHPNEIELGLERISQLARLLLPNFFHADGSQFLPFKVIIVGGTNGKGSTIAFLQSILIASGYKTGTYTSPHFLTFNERIQVNSELVTDTQLCSIFEQIETARGNISLTYFEYTTLAAICFFAQQKCEVILMEVGLGGRLDAVNLLNADASLVTTVALDHQDWLGDNIEAIAYEKAGIYRKNQWAFYGDENIPASLLKHTKKINCALLKYGTDYYYSKQSDYWTVHTKLDVNGSLEQLQFPPLAGEIQFKNSCNAVILLKSLQPKLTQITIETINRGIKNTYIQGRYQCLEQGENADVFVDVAHNPQAAKVLHMLLSEPVFMGKTHAIFAILEDKDIRAVVKQLSTCFDSWHILNLDSARAITAKNIKQIIETENNNVPISCYNEFSIALKTVMDKINSMALKNATQVKDRVIVFGSFLTVAQAIAHFKQ